MANIAPTPAPDSQILYSRYDSSGAGGVPDLTLPQFSFDRISIHARFRPEASKAMPTPQSFTIPLIATEVTQSMFGHNQAFSMETSRVAFEAILRSRGKAADVFRWLQTEGETTAVAVFVSTLTSERPEPILLQEGIIDVNRVEVHEDTIHFSCLDPTTLLHANRVFWTLPDAPFTDQFVTETSEEFGLQISAVDLAGRPFSTIFKREGNDRRSMGILSADAQTRFMYANGNRRWDLIQYAAELDDVYAFVDRGVLWYIREADLQKNCGRLLLNFRDRGNLSTLGIEHSSFQSQDAVLIMAVTNTNATNGIPSGTVYLIVSSLDEPPLAYTQLVPSLFERFSGRQIYRLPRYNLDVAKGGVQAEALAAYRELTSREFITRTTFAGHAAVNLFNRFVFSGTESMLDGVEFISKYITHSISASSGWGIELVATNIVQQVDVLPRGGRFPGEKVVEEDLSGGEMPSEAPPHEPVPFGPPEELPHDFGDGVTPIP